MRFLVNPGEQGILNTAGDRMPVGLLYIARKWGNTRVYDLNHTRLMDMVNDVRILRPEIIGVSCLTSPMVSQAQDIVRNVQGLGARIVVGGYHPTVMPQDFSLADCVIRGEGEEVTEFKHFFQEPKVTNLKGLTPNRKLLDPRAYNMQIEGLRSATAITSRGCPNSCTFCGNPNKRVRYHELSDVANDLEEVKRQGYKAVYFLDDVFTLDKIRAKAIGSMAQKIGLKYRVTTRANYTDEDLIGSLASTGCICLSMGVESGNDAILQTVGKHQTKDQIREATRLAGKYKIPVKGFFIIGLPGETEKTANETIEFSKELGSLGMKTADFYSLIPYPGTDIWTNPEKHKVNIVDRNYTHYLQASRSEPFVPVETYHLGQERIKQLIMEARKVWA
jgi:radical SAM superfamily enzyme YgiQ (UPF0313 family)